MNAGAWLHFSSYSAYDVALPIFRMGLLRRINPSYKLLSDMPSPFDFWILDLSKLTVLTITLLAFLVFSTSLVRASL